MSEEKLKKRSIFSRWKRDEGLNARRAVLEELFNDFYRDRHSIYAMNFFRGIFFGAGSVIGGALVIILAIWILGFFVDLPYIGDSAQKAQETIKSRQAN